MVIKKTRGKRIEGLKEEKQFEEQILNVDRVTRVVKGGRRFRFRVLVVVGDKKGTVGVAVEKGPDVTSAVTKAVDSAKKNLVKIKSYRGTIPHETQAKVSGANILLLPASPGTGLIAGGAVRQILEAAGIKDALSKSLGSSNKVNIAYATIDALNNLESSDRWVTNRNKPAAPNKPAAQKGVKK
jgi:small subunit ribosomal protein S5